MAYGPSRRGGGADARHLVGQPVSPRSQTRLYSPDMAALAETEHVYIFHHYYGTDFLHAAFDRCCSLKTHLFQERAVVVPVVEAPR